jgi:hypothetical protein
VPDVDAALALSAAQQVSIGFACGGVAATFDNPITACNGKGTSKLIDLPQSGEGDADHNPARVKPRHVFNLGIGTDNLMHTEKAARITASVDIANLGNKVALYNFLSTFSGTHYVPPRSFTGEIAYHF